MIHHAKTLEIAASPESVWAVIGRYMKIDEFAPFVTSVDALTDGEDGVGSKRRNHFDNGSSMVEEVLEWKVNSGYRVRSSEFAPMPLHEMLAELSIKPKGNGLSSVTWSADYRVKYGPLGWLMGQTVMKRMMGKIFDANLNALSQKVQSNKASGAYTT